MISYIQGEVISVGEGHCTILAGNVGYLVNISETLLPKLNDSISLWTYLAVRENSMDLFGFEHEYELNFFRKLINVPGIGPRSALGIMDLAPVESLYSAIINGDTNYLTKVSGIGKKTAEKIIFELRDKLDKTSANGEHISTHDGDVIDALIALGYKREEARNAVKNIDPNISDLNGRLASALKVIK